MDNMLDMINLKPITILLLIISLTIPVFAYSDEDIDLLFKNGIDAIKERKFHDALSYFNRILEQDSENVDALANKGGLLFQLQRFEEADSVLDRALMLDSNHLGALTNKSLVLHVQERFEESGILIDKVLEIDPNNVFALISKSQFLIQLERINQADVQVNKALSINPNHVTALSVKSHILFKQGDSSEALRYIKEIIKIQPSLAGKIVPNAMSPLPYKSIPGLVEIKIHDSHGNLVGYQQITKIRILDHALRDYTIDKWISDGTILIDEKKYEILKHTSVSEISENHMPGRTGIIFPLESLVNDEEKNLPGFDQQLWVVVAIHPQYRIMEGDTVTVYYTILLPIT